ncbi:MAG: hypothetical protein CSA97_04280 [Bacteroidetes bacterium]|nr:MAG: hypothetical protein CSA97_04280 [Bacteroidota bacterium]
MLNRRLLRVKVLQILYGFYSGGESSLPVALKGLRASVGRYYDLLHLLAMLPEALVSLELSQLEQRQRKYLRSEEDANPSRRFVDNAVVARLSANVSLHEYASERSLDWRSFPTELELIYDTLVEQPFYQDYKRDDATGWAHDKLLVLSLYEWLESLDWLPDFLSGTHIFWSTEFTYVLDTLCRMVSELPEDTEAGTRLVPVKLDYESWEFAEELLSQTVLHYRENQERIAESLHRWDPERVAFLDMLIMSMALAEIVTFTNIPRRVSMNEYIEIARIFSTPSSSGFVNGVLDRTVNRLLEAGEILKTGRGLQGGM